MSVKPIENHKEFSSTSNIQKSECQTSMVLCWMSKGIDYLSFNIVD
jgi:hypothetical protein